MKQFGADAFVAGSQTDRQSPFPLGTNLSAWYDEWIQTVDPNKTKKKLFTRTLNRLSQIIRQKLLSKETGIWARLAKSLVVMVQKIPAFIPERTKAVAREIKMSFSQEMLLAKNLNTQVA